VADSERKLLAANEKLEKVKAIVKVLSDKLAVI